MTRAELKARGKASLAGNWGVVISVVVIQMLITGLLGSFLSIQLTPDRYIDGANITMEGTSLNLVSLLLETPLMVGVAGVFLKLLHGETPAVTDLFDGFKLCFLAAVVAGVLTNLLVSVGTVLLIVPGVILALGFSQTAYILRTQPELNGVDAMKASWELMKGHKMELFVLELSFFPWLLACVFIIPVLYVAPYMGATLAAYYEYLCGTASGEYQSYQTF